MASGPHAAGALTRRDALLLGAAAGVGAWVGAPSAAWAGSRSFVLEVPAGSWARGGGRATGVLRAPRRFDLLGLRGRGLATAGVEVRVRKAGAAWSPWTPFGAGVEHAPDRPRAEGASDPVWAGGADELQLRARRAPRGLSVHFVAVGPAARARCAQLRGTAARRDASPAGPAGRPMGHAARVRASPGRGAQAAGGPPTIITRTEWGGDTVPPRAKPLYGDVQMAIVHHTVSANTYAAEDSAAIVLAIARYHRDTNGWNDIGYNLLVDQYGQVFEGRAGGVDLAVVGAQAQGWNSHSTGIATLGTFSDDPFPEAGVASLARVLAWKLGLHGVPTSGTVDIVSAGGVANRYPSGRTIPFERISGHRDGCETTCPGTALYGQLADLRARAGRLGGAVAAAPKLTLAPGAIEVAYGAGATFSGALLSGGRPVVGAPVELQKQGASSYVTVGRATTRADGSWSVTVPWRRGAAVRALAKVSGRASPIRSAPVSVAVGTVLAVDATPHRVLAGRSAVVTGKVRPGGAVRLRVERQTPGGGWVRVAEVPATVRSGRFRAKALLRKPGIYRLTARAGTTRKPVVASAVVVRAVRSPADVSKASGGASPSMPSAPAAAGGMAAG